MVNSGTINQFGIYASTGTAISGQFFTGLMKGNGASAPGVYAGTSCTNQFPRSLDLNGAASCDQVGSTDLAPSLSLTTPRLNVAAATSINKWIFTAPTTAATLIPGSDNAQFTTPAGTKTGMASDYSNGTTLAGNALLTGGGAGAAPNAVVLTGIAKLNGASAPTAVTAPTGAIVGTTDTQTLTNKTVSINVATKTTNYTINNTTDDGTWFNNTGAAGTVILTLPAAPAANQTACAVVTAAFALEFLAPTSTKIALGTTNSIVAGNIQSNAPFSMVCVYAQTSTQWIVYNLQGTANLT
jgi:hypothetical protein